MESKISLSKIRLSSNETWGPDPSFVFEHYKNLPFAPFNKLEKLGKHCDITNPVGKITTTTTANVTSAVPVDEEEEFKIVETKVLQKTKTNRPMNRRPQTQPTQSRQAPTIAQNKLYKTPINKNIRNYNQRINTTRTKFMDNAGVQADWNYIIDANKTNFDKMPVNNVKVVDLAFGGKIPEYDKSWNGRPNPKKNVPFALPNTISLGSGVKSDRFIIQQAETDAKTDEITVYASDAILSALLTVKNSVFPWDITVIKEGNQIFLEPSEKNKINYIDILTVNENTSGNLPEDEKELLRLCIESTNVTKKFIELSTKGTEVKSFTAKDIPTVETPEKKAYRYRKWTLDNKVNVVVRSEVDAFVKEGETQPYVKIVALNECASQLDWKENVELNKGALISTELRNNLTKICRWLCQAFLADCEQVKLAFITKPPKESKHYVLAVEDMTTKTLSNTINFRLKDSWSIVKTVADIVSKQEDGVYCFVKQAYKQSIRIYRIPDREEQTEA